MEKIITKSLLFILFILPSFAFGQIIEEDKSMSLGIKNALILELPGTSEKIVDKLWKKYSKDFEGKTKKDRRSDEWFTDDGSIVGIGGANTLDVYARIGSIGDAVSLTTWFDLGGSFLSSYEHPDEYDEAQKILLRFALEVAIESTKIELQEEEKKMKDLDNKLKRLQRDKENYEKEIVMAKERIEKAEANIIANEKDQGSTTEAIDTQKGVIEQVQEKLRQLEQ